MKWDDCFNHLSFQTLPLISMVKEFHGDIWDILYWHASVDSATLLNLAGVPLERIIIEKSIIAKTIILPWIPHWCPIELPSIHGIANNMVKIVTAKLLSKQLKEPNITDKILANIVYETPLVNDIIDKNKRLIVYFSRDVKGIRGVLNEREILDALVKHVSIDYDVVTISLQNELPTIEDKQFSW
jgi:hypothetical protein